MARHGTSTRSFALWCASLLCLSAAAPSGPGLPSEALLARPGWALRAAVEAREGGDDARALAILSDLSQRHPVIADHADRLRVEILARGDDPEQAAGVAREAVERHAKSALAPRLHGGLGDALLAAGDEAGARAAWEVALELTDRIVERSRLLAALGASHQRDGQLEPAGKSWLELWRRYPLSPEGDRAEAGLREVEQALGRSLRGGLDHRQRGDALRSAGHNEMAILAYDAALALDDMKPRDRRSTLRSRAHALFAIRRYSEAIDAYAALAPDPDSQVSRARSIARAGDVPAAIAELEAIADGRWGRASVYARYIAALLLEDEDELGRARRHFQRVADDPKHPRYANPSLWYLGWTAWRRSDPGEARQHFDELAARQDDDPVTQLQARYWSVRAAEALGEPDTGLRYARLAGEFPFTYYGWRAAQRMDAAAAAATAGEAPERPEVEMGRRALKPAELARARILLEGGLPEEATPELLRAARRAGGLRDRVEVARLLADAGEHNRAQGLIVQHYRTDLSRGPVPGLEELWWLAWPEAYGDLIRELAPDGEAIEPAVVSAVMREESGYRPAVTSSAGARGLLQIMPETGRRLASQLGLPAFTPDHLYRPAVNIQLGSFYLQQLAARFDGRWEAAIASYNAGPEAAARWTAEQPGLADDEWVEAVPYSQTRAYVKRVLRSVHAYRELY